MTYRIIETPGGEKLVLLPLAEFEALRRAAEDADDAAIFDERTAALSDGNDTRLPSEVSRLILQGDTVLCAIRKWRGKALSDVAAATGLTQDEIADLESGKADGNPETLAAIAEALNVEPLWLR